jgi:hypothetical protein
LDKELDKEPSNPEKEEGEAEAKVEGDPLEGEVVSKA